MERIDRSGGQNRSRSTPHGQRYANGDLDRPRHRGSRGDERRGGGRGSSSRRPNLREEDLIQHENSFRDQRYSGQQLNPDVFHRVTPDEMDGYARPPGRGRGGGYEREEPGREGSLFNNALASCMDPVGVDNDYTGYTQLQQKDLSRESQLGSPVDVVPSWSSNSIASMSPEDVEVIKEWLDQADNGELDIYTCLALSDITSWNDATKNLLYNIICVLVLQCIVPGAMLISEFADQEPETTRTDLDFRIGGFIMFLYSLWQLYDGSQDKCRDIFIDRGFAYQIPLKLLLPAIFGEIMNALVGICLVVSLYVIFAGAQNIAQLVMNAVAVNFLASVDTEFCEQDHLKNARANFKQIFSRGRKQGESPTRKFWRKTLARLLLMLRIGGICVFGIFLAVAFFVSHLPVVCQHAIGPLLHRWNLCTAEEIA